MMKPFTLSLLPVEVKFGSGAIDALDEFADTLNMQRILIACSPSAKDRYAAFFDCLGDRIITVFDQAAAHCPEPIVEACRNAYRDANCDGVITIGGGSTIGLGKILAAEEGATFICVPTTYSGSEMTQIFGRKIGEEKRTRKDPACRPHLVVYDPDITRSLPKWQSVTSGMNGLAHCVEALYPQKPNPLATLLAGEAIAAFKHGLHGIAADANNIELRAETLYGGMLGGVLVSMVGISVHHQLCHVIGGLYDLPHGETNSVVLPHALAYVSGTVPEAMEILRRLLDHDDPALAIQELARTIGAPTDLKSLGMPEEGIERATQTFLHHGGYSPRAANEDAMRHCLRNAWAGAPAQSA